MSTRAERYENRSRNQRQSVRHQRQPRTVQPAVHFEDGQEQQNRDPNQERNTTRSTAIRQQTATRQQDEHATRQVPVPTATRQRGERATRQVPEESATRQRLPPTTITTAEKKSTKNNSDMSAATFAIKSLPKIDAQNDKNRFSTSSPKPKRNHEKYYNRKISMNYSKPNY